MRRERVIGTVAALLALAAISAAPASATVVGRGTLRVGLKASMAPRGLPRQGRAPVSVLIATRLTTTDGSPPPQLRGLHIAINREGHLQSQGLPDCPYREIQPASSATALAACRAALVGSGKLTADVVLPQLSPLPSSGKVLAFNGRYRGKPAILAHVYGTDPFPTSYTLPFTIGSARGRFGTVLDASLSQATGEWGYLTSLTLRLGRRYRYQGRPRGYLEAGCPAPAGFPGAVFPLARADFSLSTGRPLGATVTGECKVAG